MSQVIAEELGFLLISAAWGMVMAAGYEILRLARLLFHHGEWWTGLEDLLYWTICAIWIFLMIMEENNGTIRWYALAGCGAGACVYQLLIHRILVWLLRPLWITLRKIRQFVENLLKKVGKSVTLKSKLETSTSGAERGKQNGQIRQEKEAQTESSGYVRHHPGGSRPAQRAGISDRTAAAKERPVHRKAERH